MNDEALKNAVAYRKQTGYRISGRHKERITFEYTEYKWKYICPRCHKTLFAWSRRKISSERVCEACRDQEKGICIES